MENNIVKRIGKEQTEWFDLRVWVQEVWVETPKSYDLHRSIFIRLVVPGRYVIIHDKRIHRSIKYKMLGPQLQITIELTDEGWKEVADILYGK